MTGKRIAAITIALGLILPMFNANILAAGTLNMNIKESVTIKDTQRKMFGINFEWGGEEDIYLKAMSGTTENNPSFIECFKDNLGCCRMAGTSANNFYWKKAIGPLSTRLPIYNWGWTKVNPHGPVEWIRGTSEADPTTEYVYTVNLNDTPQNAADLAEFLTGDGSINYNGGENWAKRRMEYGLEKPANIFVWELGNEMDLYGEESWPIEKYVQKAKERINAIRTVCPDAKFSCHAHTYASQKKAGWENWHRQVLKELGDDIDFISVHYYYPNTDVASAGTAIDIITDDIKAITGEDRIKILFTENACAPGSTNGDAGALYRRPHTLDGMLATAEFYVRYMHRPEVVASCYHSIKSSSWQLCYVDGTTVKSSSIFELQKLMLTNMVGNTVESELDGFIRNITCDVVSAAVKTDKGINVCIVNRSKSDKKTIMLNAEKMYKLTRISSISGTDPDADNLPGEARQIDPVIVDVSDESPIFSYEAKPLSVTILSLEEITMAPEALQAAKLENSISRTMAVKNGNSKYSNGKSVENINCDICPKIVDSTLYIPSRMAAAMFGYEASWNEDATEITFKKGENNLVYYVNSENNSAIKDGGFTYVPLRSFAEANDKEITWDNRGLAVLSDSGAIDFDAFGNSIFDSIDEILR